MSGFISLSAESSSLLPDSAYHARAAREAQDGDYAFTARAFPELYDQALLERRPATCSVEHLTPLELNDRSAPSSEGGLDGAVSSSAAPLARSSGGGLELTLHESHSGHLIGSVVWDGGKALAWVLEGMHARVRDMRMDGSGFTDQPRTQATPSTTGAAGTADAATSQPSSISSQYTPAALQEYLLAHSRGVHFDLPRDFLVGARVLELGAGTGITGLACVKLGAREVVLTDIAELVPLMQENVRRNCPGMLRTVYDEAEAKKSEQMAEQARETVEEQKAILAAMAQAEAETSAAKAAATQVHSSASVAASSAASSNAAVSRAAASSSASSAIDASTSPLAAPSAPLSSLYLTCSNCDDLCEEAFLCPVCDGAAPLAAASSSSSSSVAATQSIASLKEQARCEVCDHAWHRPAKKKGHERIRIGLGSQGADAEVYAKMMNAAASTAAAAAAGAMATSSSTAVSSGSLASPDLVVPPSSSTVVDAASLLSAPLPALPPSCAVYCEELLWGAQSSLSEFVPPSLHAAPFDVILMADVVYDAYSTSGVGSDRCDNFRRLFHTLCLLTAPHPTTIKHQPPTRPRRDTHILMTYTPRRAPEKMFFDLLATEFVWECFPAGELLPHHDSIDSRIWIYHLFRTPHARKLNARQVIYRHSEHLGATVAIERERQRDELNLRAEERKRMEKEHTTTAGRERFVSASATSAQSATSFDEESKSSIAGEERQPTPSTAAGDVASASSASASSPRVPLNFTPTFTRYITREEDRQERELQAKLNQRATKRATEHQVGR